MCGIVGALSGRPEAELREAVARMVASLRHRGPDGEGNVGVELPGGRRLQLGHARLSILDLSESAAQPMAGPGGSWLVYNGELYNYAALRSELEARGRTFRSTGDTEVVLAALEAWGSDAPAKLQGMYAFAFWDGRRLLLGRDPFGIKPLYLARSGGDLVFASELRALKASGLVALTLDRRAAASFLGYGAVIEPATIYTEAVAVPPGCVVEVDARGQAKPPRRVAPLPAYAGRAERPASYGEALRLVGGRLEAAVRSHLVSDVPVGVFLSGGVDSSLVAALADRARGGRALTFLTVGFPEQDFSEIEHARRVASRLSGKHEIINLAAEELRELLPRALSAMDQPTVDGVNTFVISGVGARLGLKVLLSGLGADEVFGGYTTFRKAPFLARWSRWISPAARLASLVPGLASAELDKVGSLNRPGEDRHAYILQRAIRWGSASAPLAPLSVPPLDAAMPPEAWEALADRPAADRHRRLSYYETTFYMRNQLLRDADVFSAAHSVELRVPFLDAALVEAAWSLPARYHGTLFGGGKRLLKDLLAGLFPGLPTRRTKMGFVLPWVHWLRGPLGSMVRDTLASPSAYAGLDIEPRAGLELLRAFESEAPLATWAQVWSLFVLLDWNERHR